MKYSKPKLRIQTYSHAYHNHSFISNTNKIIIHKTPSFSQCLRIITNSQYPNMADNATKKEEITESFHDDGSSSSDSDGKQAKVKKDFPVPPNHRNKVESVSWKEKPVHTLLGGGDVADLLLWRNKKKSAGVLGFATIIWALFEMIEYHLLSLLCHILILVLGVHFLWSNTLNFIYKCPEFPQVALDEDTVLEAASVLRHEINNALEVLREIASGKDLKEFLAVIAGLWVVSIAGSCCSLLTLVYTSFILLHTVPLLYERHKDKADEYLDKAEAELKKQCEGLQEKVLSRIPSRKDKKFA